MGDPAPRLEIDGAMVARELGLETGQFRQLMADGKISVLCERGTDDDAGTWRASVYYGQRRARFVVDSRGRPLQS